MDDYSALAQRVAVGVGDVRGCLILSRDGLVLGAYPEDDETQAKPAWMQFAVLGYAEKSFVEFADQIWVFCHRGPYSAFAVAGVSVRPGVLLDMMEQALLAAEEARTKREPMKLPEVGAAPSGKPRTSLHPAERGQPAEVAATAQRNWAGGRTEKSPGGGGAEPPPKAPATPVATPVETSVEDVWKKPPKLVGGAGEPLTDEAEEPAGDDAEVDRVLLAKEFSGLLQIDGDGDEGSS